MNDTVSWLRERSYCNGQISGERFLEGRDPSFSSVDLEPRLSDALGDRGIDRLFTHQAAAIESLRAGEDVVLATRTASGKSLAYTVAAFERAMDHGGRTLYLGPQNALVNDQEETLAGLARDLGFGSRVSVAQYTGQLSDSEKEEVRDARPTVLLSNPDMLHAALLPWAYKLWDWFFSSLELVVIDEVHEYRGVFGSQVALVLRRLARLCERYGADPEFVCCSATIGNPVEHAARVTGRSPSSFALIEEDGSGRGPRQWVLWNPPEYEGPPAGTPRGRRRSSHTEARRLFVDLVAEGFQTLCFTRARQAAERYATESANELRNRGESGLAQAVTAYQAALPDGRRQAIEAGLRTGDIRGVWSTSALELGVDIGGLDAVVLDGYPGTRMSAFQRAGRAGRGDDPALVVMIGGEDQLDQYMLSHPDEFFAGEIERAMVDPDNEQLLPTHVLCAAQENWLSPADEGHFGPGFVDAVRELDADGSLDRRETDEGVRWLYTGDGSPQHETNLRTAEEREVSLLDARNGSRIATLGLSDAFRDAHPGAIYHHQGQDYEITDLDPDRGIAELQPTWADYYTRVLTDKTVTVETDIQDTTLSTRPDTPVRFADVSVTTQVTGYERRDSTTGETLGREPLSLPETTLRTKAVYYTVPEEVETSMRELGGDHGFNGGIHAAEHGTISLLPLTLLCDRADVGGLSTPFHSHTDAPTVFIYDGHPGGVGLTRAAYADIEPLLIRTGRLISACGCTDGCPACVQSPHCGNANEPLNKETAVILLDSLTPGDEFPESGTARTDQMSDDNPR